MVVWANIRPQFLYSVSKPCLSILRFGICRSLSSAAGTTINPWWAITAPHRWAEWQQVVPDLTTDSHTPKFFSWTPQHSLVMFNSARNNGSASVARNGAEGHVSTWCAFQGFFFWLAQAWSCGLNAHLWLGYIRSPPGACLWGGYLTLKEPSLCALLLCLCVESTDLWAVPGLNENADANAPQAVHEELL